MSISQLIQLLHPLTELVMIHFHDLRRLDNVMAFHKWIEFMSNLPVPLLAIYSSLFCPRS